jgi:hypothetical protein
MVDQMVDQWADMKDYSRELSSAVQSAELMVDKMAASRALPLVD